MALTIDHEVAAALGAFAAPQAAPPPEPGDVATRRVNAKALFDAGAAAELHVHPGCPHGFDAFGFDTSVSRRAMADRIRRLRQL